MSSRNHSGDRTYLDETQPCTYWHYPMRSREEEDEDAARPWAIVSDYVGFR